MPDHSARIEKIQNGFIVSHSKEVKKGKGKESFTDYQHIQKYFKNEQKAANYAAGLMKGHKKSSQFAGEIPGA